MPTSEANVVAHLHAPTRATDDPLNDHVAALLEETARLLEEQHANAFRVQAYRNAADTVRGLHQGVDDILDAEGQAGLDRLPGIGATLARVIDQLVSTGRFSMLERLRSGHNPVAGSRPYGHRPHVREAGVARTSRIR